MKYAFVANPSVGHTNFLISLASEFIKNREEICFYLPGTSNKLIRRFSDDPIYTIDKKLSESSIPYKLISPSIFQFLLASQIHKKRGVEEVLYALKIFSAGSKHYTKILRSEFASFKPDCIIYDYTFFPAIAISEELNIARVAVYHSGLPFLEYPIPPIGSNFKYNAFTKEEFDQYYSLVKDQDQKIKTKYQKVIGKDIETNFLLNPNSTFLNIINTIAEAEYPRHKLNQTVHFSGPAVKAFNKQANQPFIDKKDKKHIYISLGTVFNKQPELYKRIIQSIHSEKVEIIVSAGASYDVLKNEAFPQNVRIERSVRQVEVLQYTDVFITHGGKNSINEAIKFGVPMILFPAGGEQHYNANLIEYLGVGKNFGAIGISFKEEELNKEIKKLIENPEIQKKCKELFSLHCEDGAEKAYNIISTKIKKRIL